MVRLNFPKCFDRPHKAANIEDTALSKSLAGAFWFQADSILFPNQNYGHAGCLTYGRRLHTDKRFPTSR